MAAIKSRGMIRLAPNVVIPKLSMPPLSRVTGYASVSGICGRITVYRLDLAAGTITCREKPMSANSAMILIINFMPLILKF